jgi:hypothetical protein
MSAAPQTGRFDELANSPMVENRPTSQTSRLLRDELLFQRATQTYLWALPLINTLGMKFGSEEKFGAGYHVLPVWKKRLSAKTLITTPNSDVIYAMSYIDVSNGPMVFKAPPGLQGILLDFWQRPIAGPTIAGRRYFGDVGLPGPDGGKGGEFLIVPPGYDKPVPEGYYVYRSGTRNVFVFLRSFYQDEKKLAPAVALMEAAKIYPLGVQLPKAMVYPDASGIPANMLPRSDVTAFEQLKWLVDNEGERLADPDWMGMLATIGIIKDKPFKPDDKARAILDRAARTAYKTSRVIGFEELVSGRDFRVYPDRHWINPMADGTPQNPSSVFDIAWHRKDGGGYLDLDTRIWFFTDYYSISPGMISQVPGKGAKYMIAFTDNSSTPLTGAMRYRVHLPPKIPAANFWSLTLYEAENASGLDNGQPFPSLGSRDKPVQDADGSTTLYLGPSAPAGKQANWLATVPGKGYFAILRLYGPTEEAINKSWKPGDIEKVN